MESEDRLEIAFSNGFDSDAKDLICNLLVENPNMRIGMLREGVADVWAHPFLRSFPADKVAQRNLVPPYKPDEQKKSARPLLNDVIIGDFDNDGAPPFNPAAYDFSSF